VGQARKNKNRPELTDKALEYTRQVLRGSSFMTLGIIALYLLVALISFDSQDSAWSQTSLNEQINNLAGRVGAWFADISLHFFGHIAYLLPLGLGYLGWCLFRGAGIDHWTGELIMYRALGIAVTLIAGSGLATLMLGPAFTFGSGGGIVGDMTSRYLVDSFSAIFSSLFLLALFLAGLSLATGISWLVALDAFGRAIWSLPERLTALFALLNGDRRDRNQTAEDDDSAGREATATSDEQEISQVSGAMDTEPADTVTNRNGRLEPTIGDMPGDDSADAGAADTITSAAEPASAGTNDTTVAVDEFRPVINRTAGDAGQALSLPKLTLLDMPPEDNQGYTPETLNAMRQHLEKLLQDFGIAVKVVNVIPGPVITSFELEPAPGVKVSQITKLDKDLARGLSATSVRVVEVIPGKSVVGLEIPNEQRMTIYLNEILGSNPYRRSDSPLTLGLGKDTAGNPVVANLAAMPHLLVAGTTGSGKSVALNAMLLSILFKATAQEVKMILIDPKMLELSIYEDIPHLLTRVVTDMKEAFNALQWCINEMERRYRVMAALKVRSIEGYNRKVKEAIDSGNPIPDPLQDVNNKGSDNKDGLETLEPMPLLVVVIDELADLMMATSKKVEEPIVRLAQKARAAGIHLILATQRPSVDVITGLIKSNIRTRIAFQVASKVDSRTILDQMGAETLLGHGDMLFLPPGKGFPERVHGAFVADHEVQQVVDYLKQSGQRPTYADNVLQTQAQQTRRSVKADAGPAGAADDNGEADPLLEQAKQIVLDNRRISTSGLQRKLGVGYSRAAQMLETMEQEGIVGPVKNGTREVKSKAR
jgi:S-DNA-T family DNA segregation ATPase FtsK/SpoIIIE